MTTSPPQAPYGVSATGVQRAIGERRRRRDRERGGHVDLDATMSSWPSPDPPSRSRPVVRPRRALPGAATAPALPTPQALLVREQTQPAPRGSTPVPAGRRGRRSPGRDTQGLPTGSGLATGAGTAAGPFGSGVAGGAAGATGGAGSSAMAMGAAGAATAAAVGTIAAARAARSTPHHEADAHPATERRAAGDPGLRVVTRPRLRTAGHTPPVASPTVSPVESPGQSSVGPPGPATASRRARTRDADVAQRPPAPDQSDPFSAFPPRSPGSTEAVRRPRIAAATVSDATVAAVGVSAGGATAGGATEAVPRARARSTAPPVPDATPQNWTDTGEGPGPVRLRRRDRDGRGAGGPGLTVADDRDHGERARGPLSGVRGSFGHLTDARSSRSVPALDDRPSRRPALSAPVIGAIVAGLVALVVVGALLLRPGNGTDPSTALVPPAAPQQATVLVTLLGEDQTVSRAMLLAVGPGPSGPGDVVGSVLVPGDLTVPVPDAGSLPFSQSITVDAQAPDRAVEDVLGVRVDGTWVMDVGLLADHVDTAGGVEVDVAAAVVAGDVTVPVGTDQLLTGAQAAAYATAPIDGEEPEALLARFAQVMLGLVEAVPQEPGEVTQLLSQVDRHPATTATSEQLSRILAEASALIAAQGLPASAAVPTTGGDDSPLVADREAVEVLVDERLSGARLPESVVGPLDVVVGNAVGDPGLVTAARDRLVEAGFRFAGGGTLEGDAAPATTVLVPEDTPENRERGLAVAAALGVPADALFVKADFTADVPEGTDIIVWLGQDYVVGGADDGSGGGGSQ